MFKAMTTNDEGRPVIMLGLTRKDLEDFLENVGKGAMSIDLEELGVDGKVLLFAGEDDKAIADRFDNKGWLRGLKETELQ